LIVVGVGNLLMKDDGIGIHVIRKMSSMKEFEGVEIVDAMTNVHMLLSAIEGKKKAIIVDAIDFDGEPGEVKVIKFNPNEEDFPSEIPLTIHDLHFRDAIMMARGVYDLPEELVIVGVKPKEIALEIGLSEEVRAKIDEVIEIIKKELSVSDT